MFGESIYVGSKGGKARTAEPIPGSLSWRSSTIKLSLLKPLKTNWPEALKCKVAILLG